MSSAAGLSYEGTFLDPHIICTIPTQIKEKWRLKCDFANTCIIFNHSTSFFYIVYYTQRNLPCSSHKIKMYPTSNSF